MKTTWEHYQSRRRIVIPRWLNQYGITSYEQLDKFCHGRNIETPPLELVERYFPKPPEGFTRVVLPTGTSQNSSGPRRDPVPEERTSEEKKEAPDEPDEGSASGDLPSGLKVDKDGFVVSSGGDSTGGS